MAQLTLEEQEKIIETYTCGMHGDEPLDLVLINGRFSEIRCGHTGHEDELWLEKNPD